MTSYRSLLAGAFVGAFFMPFPSAQAAEPAVATKDFVLIEAEDSIVCKVEGRVETHIYPRTAGRKMVLLHPGSRLTTTTEAANISLVLPPVFTSPGPRYGNFLPCRLRVRVDDLPWQELAQATARRETVVAENLPAGKHTLTVEPVEGLAVVDAFRFSEAPLAGFAGTLVPVDYSELFTDARIDIFRDDLLIRTEYVGCPRSGTFELYGLPAGVYRLNIRAAGWIDSTLSGLKIDGPGHRPNLGVILLKRDPRCGGEDGQDRPGPHFGHSISVSPGNSFKTLVNLPGTAIQRARLRSRFKSVDLEVSDTRKFPLGIWNDVGEATFRLPKDIPHDMYDLVLSFATKQGEVQRVSGQAVCVRPSLPAEFHVAGCGHMNTWGQQTAEYLTRVAETARLAGARTLLIANEVNAAYISGALRDLCIPYVVSPGNHTFGRWDDFYGPSSRAHDDGPMRIADFGRRPYEPWNQVEALFQRRPDATNRIVVCYEGFAPISLIQEQELDLLFDAHSDNAHVARDAFPPRAFHMRAPTQESLRWIPMTHHGLDPQVKANADVPILTIPRTGPSPLRTTFQFAEDGTADRQIVTITNEYPLEFPRASVRLVLRRGTYEITGGAIAQKFDSDDGEFSIIDVVARVAAKSTTPLQALRKGEPGVSP